MSNPKNVPGNKQKTQPGAEKPIVAIGDGFERDPSDELLDENGRPVDRKKEPTMIVPRKRKNPHEGPIPIPQSLLEAAKKGVQPGEEPIEVKEESLPPRAPSSPPKLADDTDEQPRPSTSQALQQLVNEEFVKNEETKLFSEPLQESDLFGFSKDRTDVDGEPPQVSQPPVPMNVLPDLNEKSEGFVARVKWLLGMPLRAFRFLQNVANAGLDAAAALEMSQNNRSAFSSLRFTVETEKQANIDSLKAVRSELTEAEKNVLREVSKIRAFLENPETKPAKFNDVWVLARRLISQDENLSQMISGLVTWHIELEDTLDKLKKTYFANPENILKMMSQLKKRDEIRYETAQKMESFETRFGHLITQDGLTEVFVNSALPQIKQLIEAEQREAWSKLSDQFFGEMDKFAKEWSTDMQGKYAEAKQTLAKAKEDLDALKSGSEIFVPVAQATVDNAQRVTKTLTDLLKEAQAWKIDEARVKEAVEKAAQKAVDEYLVSKIMTNAMPSAPEPAPEVNAPEQWMNPAALSVQPETEVAEGEDRTSPDLKMARKSAVILDDDDAFDDGPTKQEKPAEFEAEAEEILPVADAPASPPAQPPPSSPQTVEQPTEQSREEAVKADPLPAAAEAPKPMPQAQITDLAKAMNPPLFSRKTRNSLISAALISIVLVLIGIKGPQWFAHKTESNEVRVPQAEALEIVVPDAAAESPMSEAPQAEPEQVEPPREEARAEEVPPKREEKARRPPKRKKVVDEFDDIGLPPGIRTKKGGSR